MVLYTYKQWLSQIVLTYRRYIVCFDLSKPLPEQREQLSFWLNFMQSSLDTVTDTAWKVVVVGTKSDIPEHICTQRGFFFEFQ